MRESAKAALGGMIAALSVSIMLLTYLSPFLVYSISPIRMPFIENSKAERQAMSARMLLIL